MDWTLRAAIVIGCLLALPSVAKIAGVTPRASSPAPAAVVAPYDVTKDPEFIEMSRIQDVKLLDVKWTLGGFDTLLIASFTIRNARNVIVKDVIVRCDVSAESGTQIGSLKKTIYQTIEPGKSVKISKLSMGFLREAQQAKQAACYAENHSDY